MNDLKTQLLAYGRQIEDGLTATDQIDEAPLIVLKPEPPRSSRRWSYALIAALVVVGIALPLVLVRRNSPPVATTVPPGLSNGWVAFSGARTDTYDIWMVREGESARRIIGTDGDGLDQFCPTFSPDGSKLAYFESDHAGLLPGELLGDAQLVVVEFDGTGEGAERFRMDAGWRGCQTWSPDSNRIAFVTDYRGAVEGASQYVLNTATLEGAVTPLFEGFSSHFEIGWSPDGSAIAVSAQFGDSTDDLGPTGTWLVPVSGSQPQVLFESESRLPPESHSWAPDGSRVAVLGSGNADGEGFIKVLGIDGSSDSFPVNGPAQGDSIAWSPDGARLAYVNREDDRLTLVDPDGTDFVGLEAGVINGPVWSPDGTFLLVTLANGDGATVVSVSPDPGIPVTVLMNWDEGVQYLAGMSWQPVP